AAESCATAVDLPCAVATRASDIAAVFEPDAPEVLPGEGVRLAGLLLATDQDPFDLASPKRAPDRTARVRQLAMAALLGVVLLVGGGLTLANRELSSLREQLEILDGHRDDAAADRSRALRDAARLAHAERWMQGGTDWTLHLERLSSAMPSREAVLLNRIDGSARTTLDYRAPRRRMAYDEKHWQFDVGVVLTVAGRARDRDAADAGRGAFVESDVYTVAPVGADGKTTNDQRYPHAFTLRLSTSEAGDK
ncbi:MAG: hypothetical protein AAFX05_07105, partial [Planctomycetota bacterium]